MRPWTEIMGSAFSFYSFCFYQNLSFIAFSCDNFFVSFSFMWGGPREKWRKEVVGAETMGWISFWIVGNRTTVHCATQYARIFLVCTIIFYLGKMKNGGGWSGFAIDCIITLRFALSAKRIIMLHAACSDAEIYLLLNLFV